MKFQTSQRVVTLWSNQSKRALKVMIEPQRLADDSVQESDLYDSILRLGHFFELDFSINIDNSPLQLRAFASEWRPFDSRSPQNPSLGLSVISLTGTGKEAGDIGRLNDLNREHGVRQLQSDFRIPTKFASAVTSTCEVLNYFGPHVARSYYLRLDSGGFVPPMRECRFPGELKTFQLVQAVTYPNQSSFVFLHGEQRVFLKEGSVYFFNALMSHSLFSFSDNVVLLFCNVVINSDSVRLLRSKLLEK